MPDHHDYRDDDQELFNADTHHESTDVPVRPLLWSIVIVIVFAIVTHIVLGFMYKGFVAAERKRMDPPQTTVARAADADVPQNQPLLQPFPREGGENSVVPPQASTPVSDMATMRAAEDAALLHYGWVDRQHGTVRIPIHEAKALLAARLAVQGQLGGGPAIPAAQAPSAPAVPGSDPAAAGNPVSPDTGIAPGPSTTPSAAAPPTTATTPLTTPGSATTTTPRTPSTTTRPATTPASSTAPATATSGGTQQ